MIGVWARGWWGQCVTYALSDRKSRWWHEYKIIDWRNCILLCVSCNMLLFSQVSMPYRLPMPSSRNKFISVHSVISTNYLSGVVLDVKIGWSKFFIYIYIYIYTYIYIYIERERETSILQRKAIFSILDPLKVPVEERVTLPAEYIFPSPLTCVTNKITVFSIYIATVHFHMTSQICRRSTSFFTERLYEQLVICSEKTCKISQRLITVMRSHMTTNPAVY